MEKKKWYQSKIILLSLSTALVVGGNLLTGFLTGQGVTPEQLNAIAAAEPEVAEAVQRVQAGDSILQVIAGLFPVIVLILRVWFTNTAIATK
jgi:hypothetical protein